jgi:two-component system sensor histidine kinase VanS
MKLEEFKDFRTKIAFKCVFEIIFYSFVTMCIVFLFIDFLLNDFLAEIVYSMDPNLYYYFISNKLFVIFVILLLVVLFVSFFVIRKSGKYFVDIIDNIDGILKNPEKDVLLPNVLSLLEGKLNQIRLDIISSKNSEKEAILKKNDLIMYMAHDLKTPLTSVIGYLTLLNEEKNISKSLRDKYSKIALDKALRVEDLTNQFFEITRYNLSEVPLSKSNINLSILLNQLVDECYPMMESKGLKFNISVNEDIIIKGDGDKLARAFENLIRNAINYGFEGSVVDIFVESKDDSVVLIFRNKGERIPQYKLDRIFDKFYRCDESRSSQAGGAGLGLAISKDIINLHGGNISVSSDDEFITFTVSLPL